MIRPPLVSFCTGCMGRLDHLRQVYLDNILFNYHTYPCVEFVLLDYNSRDGLEDWVDRQLAPLIEVGIVTYVRERSRQHWNMSHAKNVAHLAASGEIVCNLDADNRAVPDFAAHLAACFQQGAGVVSAPRPRRHLTYGTGGRIALKKADFVRLGGYNEDFTGGYGLEDHELLVRAERAGLKLTTWDERYETVLEHSNAERSCNLPVSWDESTSQAVMLHGQTQAGQVTEANRGRVWGTAEVYVGDKLVRVGSDSHPLERAAGQPAGVEALFQQWLRTARPPVREPHAVGRATGEAGAVTMRLRLGRGPAGGVKVERASCECDSERAAHAAALLVKLIEGNWLAVTRQLAPPQLLGRLCDDLSAARLAVDAFQNSLAGI